MESYEQCGQGRSYCSLYTLDNIHRLFFCYVATFSSKTKVWENICGKVNAANSDHKRSVEELRKKWSTCTSNAKKQAALFRRESWKIGGGPLPEKLCM
jgi:hypothetical protein